MSISRAPAATAKPARPTVVSSLRRHIAAIVLVMMFAAGLGVALCLAVSPLDLGHRGLSDMPGAWTR